MKKYIVALMVVLFLGCGMPVFAADSETDCECVKGGIGLPLGRIVIGVGFRQYNAKPDCETSIGIGLGVGGEKARIQIGGGYNQGVIGLGIGIKGPDKVTIIGPAFGYDYSDCRLVWPIEE